jgi:hypothetical protein
VTNGARRILTSIAAVAAVVLVSIDLDGCGTYLHCEDPKYVDCKDALDGGTECCCVTPGEEDAGTPDTGAGS